MPIIMYNKSIGHMPIMKGEIKMARFDGTGPRGQGPMTGKVGGYCAGNIGERPVYGRGMGRGAGGRFGLNRGMGRCMAGRFPGRGMGRYYIEDPEYLLDSKQALEEEKEILEKRLNNVKDQLENSNDK